nr:polysaccharide biosynthesis C-terminal domain-containing protein [Natrinema salifodinae]
MIDFLSKFTMSFSGFIGTIVLTRTLGQEKYGTYVVVISVLAWIAIAGNLGLDQAVKKRISEASEGNYVVAGAIAQFGLYVIVAVCLWLVRPFLNAYMGIDATLVLIGLLAARLAVNFVQMVLDGQHLVHVSSLLSPIKWTSRSIVQIALVLSGFGLAGAFAGYVVGALVAAVIGSHFVSFDPSLPSRRDFTRLKSYAQFSWLTAVKGRTFLSMDTLVLAVFVSNSLIAVYEIAWNLASLFAIFGSSVRRALFPEISRLSSKGSIGGEIVGLLRVSLTYSGLFIIPGFIGVALVGDIVLRIYGPGFDTGYYILLILTFARLLYGYQGQFLNTLAAIDRPDLTFRINGIFVASNLVLNGVLTWQFGWYGAATATTLSAMLGLILGYYYASTVIDVVIPTTEIGKQVAAAGVMAVVVYVLRIIVDDSLPIVVVIIGVGSGVYFSVLFILSREFRTTVEDNLPFRVPVLDKR